MSKSLTLRSGRRVVLSDAGEESAIQAGIEADPEAREPSDDEAKALRRLGRPPLAVTKERITIRLSPDVVTSGGSMSLLPLKLALFAILALPAVAAATFGAKMRMRNR